jgi:glycosyltransferase involved in cell wall biosynthesis
LKVSLIEPPPSRLSVGRGSAIFLHGRLEDVSGGFRSLRLEGGGGRPPVDVRIADGEWWATLALPPIAAPEALTFNLQARLQRGGEATAGIGTVELAPEPAPVTPAEGLPEGGVAICMGTHNPPLELFERQVESIRSQTHRRWLCLISDDGSTPEALDGIRRILADDARFALFPAQRRRGFYANYERVLSLVPRSAAHVALCDQDDRWYPEKLELLLGALGNRHTLAYSDMRIVTPAGERLSDTYWKHRRNNWSDLGTLLLGNTITGAASLFRRSLLDYALPFPPRVGRAFHDHWLAVVALACGDVSYVDRPLHDYVQHPGVVIGFYSANADRGFDRGLAALSARSRRLAGRLIRPQGRQRYFADYCRIALLATVLELRCAELMSAEKRRAVERVRRLDHSLATAAGLALRSLAPRGQSNQTMRVDRSVLAGLAWSRLNAGPQRDR